MCERNSQKELEFEEINALIAKKTVEKQAREQAETEYEKNIERARVFCVRGKYEEARKIYEGFLKEDPVDMNGYMGLIRIATKDYTEFEGDEIEESIRVAKRISRREDLSGFDVDYADYAFRREAYLADKEVAEAATDLVEAFLDLSKEERSHMVESIRLHNEGDDCYEDGRYEQAVEYFLQSAGMGFPHAQRRVGECYYVGRGVPEDYTEAVKWFRKAADNGDVIAQYWMGECYYRGNGVTKDDTEAAKWYKKAADGGDADAQATLGAFYLTGTGVTQNMAAAMTWFRKAAEQGNDTAQYQLGVGYYFGKGVPKDEKEAVKWFKEAAEQGHEDAQKVLDHLQK